MTLAEALEASAVYTDLINNIFVINPTERTIAIPEDEEVFGTYQDRNSERKYFSCPRYVGDMVDLYDCYIYIIYKSLNGESGRYLCDDLAIDGDNVTFSWLLSDNVFDTNQDGTVSFSVKAISSDSEIVFNTRPAEGNAYATNEDPEEDTEDSEYSDVINQILAMIDGAESIGISSIEQTESSTEYGGENEITITLTSGKTYTFSIYNGSNGADGTGISSVTQTTISTASGGENVITVVLSNGDESTFSVYNGAKGDTGETGATGATGETGPTGTDGASAYDAAVSGGYTGTEEEFNTTLAEIVSMLNGAEEEY